MTTLQERVPSPGLRGQLRRLAKAFSLPYQEEFTVEQILALFNQALAHKNPGQYISFMFTGQSNAQGGYPMPAGTTLETPEGVLDWTKENGTGDYGFYIPDPAGAEFVSWQAEQPRMGYVRGNTGDIGLACAVALREWSGHDVLMFKGTRTGQNLTDGWDFFGASSNVMNLLKTQYDAAKAAHGFVPEFVDFFLFTEGFADAKTFGDPAYNTGAQWAAEFLDLRRRLEDPNFWGLCNDNTQYATVGTPRRNKELDYSFNGPEIAAEWGDNRSHFISLENVDYVDSVHIQPYEANQLGQEAALAFLGVRNAQVTPGGWKTQPDYVIPALVYDYGGIEEWPFSTMTGLQVKWNAAGTVVALGYDQIAGATQPSHLAEQFNVGDKIRVFETATPANYIEFTLTAPGLWDSQSSPTFIQFIGVSMDDGNWSAPAVGTDMTATIYNTDDVQGRVRSRSQGYVSTRERVREQGLTQATARGNDTGGTAYRDRRVNKSGVGVATSQYEQRATATVAGLFNAGSNAFHLILMSNGEKVAGEYEIRAVRSGGAATEYYHSRIPFAAHKTGGAIVINAAAEEVIYDGSTAAGLAMTVGNFSNAALSLEPNGLTGETWKYIVTCRWEYID